MQSIMHVVHTLFCSIVVWSVDLSHVLSDDITGIMEISQVPQGHWRNPEEHG